MARKKNDVESRNARFEDMIEKRRNTAGDTEAKVSFAENDNTMETKNSEAEVKPSFMENVIPPKQQTTEPKRNNRFANEIQKELETEPEAKATEQYIKPAKPEKKITSLPKTEPVVLSSNDKAGNEKKKNKSMRQDEQMEKGNPAEKIKEKINRLMLDNKSRYAIIGIAGVLLVLYTVGFLTNMMKLKMTVNPITNIVTAVSSAENLKMSFIMGIGLVVLIIFLTFGKGTRNGEDGRNINFADSDQYGSSGWMTREEKIRYLEIKNNVKDVNGIILGKEQKTGRIIALPDDSSLNRNIFVCGNQGTWKSWGYARNAILQAMKNGYSVVVADPKGELYRDLAPTLMENDYVIKQFNLKDHMASDSWNCLADLNDDDIPIFCDTVIRNTMEEGKNWDPFYDGNVLNMLKALVFYVKKDPDIPEEQKTLPTAYEMLALDVSELDRRFAMLDRNHPGKMSYSLFKSEKIKENTLGSLGTRLQILQNDKIKHVVGHTEIDLALPAKKKCAYFIIKSDQEATYDVLGTLFLTYLFIKNVKYADSKPNMKTDIPIHFVLDEFSQFGYIPDFKKKFATVRSRGIGISMLVQYIPQMYDRFGMNQTAEYIGGCDTILLLGCNDQITKEFFSNMTGNATITVDTVRKNLQSIRLTDWTPQYSESEGLGTRPLLYPDEVGRLKSEEREKDLSLLFISGCKPLLLNKYGFHETPIFKSWGEDVAAHQLHPAAHVPEWINELKDNTNFRLETGGLYNMQPFPDYFEERFEKWREEAFAEIERGNPAFDRRKKKITITGRKKLETIIERLNIEQGEDVYEYIVRTLENGMMDTDSYSSMYDSRRKKEEKREQKRQELINKVSKAKRDANEQEENTEPVKTANEQKKTHTVSKPPFASTGNANSEIKEVSNNTATQPQEESITDMMKKLKTYDLDSPEEKKGEESASGTSELKISGKTLNLTITKGGNSKKINEVTKTKPAEQPQNKSEPQTKKREDIGVMDVFNQLKNGN